jgi:hypothetical protein
MNKKEEVFIRLAKNRVNKAIKTIKLIGNLSNKSHYKYSQNQISQITNALDKEIKIIKEKFKNSKKLNQKDEFEFK